MLPVASTAMPPPTLQGGAVHGIAGAGVLPPKYVEYAMPPVPGTLVFTSVTKNWRLAFGKFWYANWVAGKTSVEGWVAWLEVVVPVIKTSLLRSIVMPLAWSLPLPET